MSGQKQEEASSMRESPVYQSHSHQINAQDPKYCTMNPNVIFMILRIRIIDVTSYMYSAIGTMYEVHCTVYSTAHGILLRHKVQEDVQSCTLPSPTVVPTVIILPTG
jgi:hypothetical protein